MRVAIQTRQLICIDGRTITAMMLTVVVGLAGCSPGPWYKYRKSGATQEQFNRDYGACKLLARVECSPIGLRTVGT